MPRRSESVGGVRMSWEESGMPGGTPVVLIHGIPTSPRLWRHVTQMVSGARCLAWEMVGYGSSIPEGRDGDRDISVARQAEYLLSWLDSQGIDQAVLVGHDLGGGVAQIAAVRRPEVCAGLVLTNSVCYDSWPIPLVKAIRACGPLLERLPDPLFKPLFMPLFALAHDNGFRASESARIHWEGYARHGGGRAAAALVRQARSLDNGDTMAVAGDLPKLRVPARVVWGEADAFQKVGYGERLARDLGTTLERVVGGEHFVPEDRPDRVAAAIDAVLEEAGV